MDDREHADRREQERRRRAQPEHLDGEVALGGPDEHPRPQPDPLERLAVGADGRFRACAAGDVVERPLLQLCAGGGLPVLGRDGPLRAAGEVDRVLDLASRLQHVQTLADGRAHVQAGGGCAARRGARVHGGARLSERGRARARGRVVRRADRAAARARRRTPGSGRRICRTRPVAPAPASSSTRS